MKQQLVNLASISKSEWLAKLMDSRFRIPGTNIRFGLDAIIGLIPGVGDFVTLAISGFMLSSYSKQGVSGYLLARMSLNIILDALIGSIPFIGDLFDIAFKANQRNLKLLQEHYKEGKHQGSSMKLAIPVFILLILIVVGITWLSWKLFQWLVNKY